MLQACNDVGAGEAVRFGPQHQVAGTQAQAAVVDQQVPHLHLLRDPRVVHAELRQVLDDRVVPLQPAGIDQAREHARRHRLAVGRDLEQRVVVDLPAATGLPFAERTGVDDVAIADDAHRQSGQPISLEGLFHRDVEGIVGGCRMRDGRQQRKADKDVLHGVIRVPRYRRPRILQTGGPPPVAGGGPDTIDPGADQVSRTCTRPSARTSGRADRRRAAPTRRRTRSRSGAR